MSNVLIVTLYGNFNYGNKLQNYAVQELIKDFNYNPYTLTVSDKKNLKIQLKRIVKKIINKKTKNDIRINNFKEFDRLINKVNERELNKYSFSFILLGSDQIWNPYDLMSNYLINKINNIKNIDKFSFSASVAVNDIPTDLIDEYVYHFDSMKYISVREQSGKELINKYLPDKQVDVLLDPTMLIDENKWINLIKKPENINASDKFVLVYFLGKKNDDRLEMIYNFASKNGCKVINILDQNSIYYSCGPEEFLWLEKNAFMIFTDSFHSSVFAILFKRPFLVFNRNDGQKGINKMNSRLDNLLTLFKLESRYFKKSIDEDALILDYSYAHDIIKKERKKAYNYLNKILKKGD